MDDGTWYILHRKSNARVMLTVSTEAEAEQVRVDLYGPGDDTWLAYGPKPTGVITATSMCDFCTSPDVEWNLTTDGDLAIEMPSTSGKTYTHMFSPEWWSCTDCLRALLENGAEGLTERWRTVHIKRRFWALSAQAQETARMLHQKFYENWDGKVVQLKGGMSE